MAYPATDARAAKTNEEDDHLVVWVAILIICGEVAPLRAWWSGHALFQSSLLIRRPFFII